MYRTFAPERAILPQVSFLLLVLAIARSSQAGLLNFAYVPMVTLVGLWLVLARPLGYIGFVFWIWMITPLIRRMVDLVSGYHQVSFVMIAPLALTLLSVLAIVKKRRMLPSAILLPLTVIGLVLTYGFFIGATSQGITAAAFALVNWGTPVLFGVYILCSPEPAAMKAHALFQALVWGGSAMGLYGLYQFFYLPVWDEYWMRMSELQSIGLPAPLQVRVFGTLNSPAILGFFMASSLLAALAAPGLRSKVASLPGVVTFLLSLVRSAWGGFAVALVLLVSQADRKRRTWYVSGLAVLVLATLPVLATSTVGNIIGSRAQSFSNISGDDSLAARLDIYRRFSGSSTSAVFGLGLGSTGDVSSRLGTANQDSASTVIDSGFLEIISDFGIFSIFMFLALGSLLLRTILAARLHPSALTAAVIALAAGSQLLLANPFFGPAAMCFYPFVGLALLFGIERETHHPASVSSGAAAQGERDSPGFSTQESL
jgi:hypothetical protein